MGKKNEEDGWLCAEFAKMAFDKEEDYGFGCRCFLVTLAAGTAVIEPFVKAAKALGIDSGPRNDDYNPMLDS